jgi:hypothetical protein
MLLAAIDVEWTKNYRIRNGNRPFCYSIIYTAVPNNRTPSVVNRPDFEFTSVYVEHDDETTDLIIRADAEMRAALEAADLICGHQFTSDLAVLANAATTLGLPDPPAVQSARAAWRSRQAAALRDRPSSSRPAVVDTRYDTDHVLGCSSRRLVDVCTDLRLNVAQPELRGTSMTALHRDWLKRGEPESRERISVLNLRHSLSTALVALHATGYGSWDSTLNVNRLLASGLGGAFDWLAGPTFADLL